MTMIYTHQPFLTNRNKITREIADFWDQVSEGFRMVWGVHIHHGYFENDNDSPARAQELLTERLAGLLNISRGDNILDVGCGMGGSSLYLAKKYAAIVTGISLSQKQLAIARESSKEEKVTHVDFRLEDALSLASFKNESFEYVWSLESCEQFFDKRQFIAQAYRVLKPGGRLMLATWCSGAEIYAGTEAKKYTQLCKAFQLPYMPTLAHYAGLLGQQGFIIENAFDWTSKTGQSWKIGLAGKAAGDIFKIFVKSGWRGLQFLKDARLMKQGFEENRIKYGVFIAQKPLRAQA